MTETNLTSLSAKNVDADLIPELTRRQKSLGEIILKRELDAVLVIGNSVVGPPAMGSFRYYTGHRVYYHYQAIIARPDKPLLVCCGSVLGRKTLIERGFEDIRVSPDIFGSVMTALSEQPIKRLGVSMDSLPSLWYRGLEKKGISFVDVTDDIFAVRNERSEFEVFAIRECAKMADAGYKAVCDMAKPGVRMSDLHTELDYAMKREGAEETFTLMSNGRFSFVNNRLPMIKAFSSSDDRVVRDGDSIAMEITPKYLGYWTQMVRTVCVGEPNPDLETMHKTQLETMNATVPLLKPGMKLGEVLSHMWHYGSNLGYECRMPFGHIVGIDLDEGGRASLESDVILKEYMNFVLHPTLVMGNNDFGFFWGDPYFVTENGGERLTKSSTELQIL